MRPSTLARSAARTLPALALVLAACNDEPIAPAAARAPAARPALDVVPGVLEELQPLAPGQTARPYDVADGGAAVGASIAVENGVQHPTAVFWPAGSPVPVNLGGTSDATNPYVVARAISHNGRWIVGEELIAGQWTVVRWDGIDNRPVAIMPYWLDDYQAYGVDVADDGTVLGQFFDYGGGAGSRGFVYKDDEFRVVSGLAGRDAVPTKLDANGAAVGYGDDPITLSESPFVDNGVGAKLPVDGAWARAYASNGLGTIVGTIKRGDNVLTHPIVWQDRKIAPALKDALGAATDVNARGDVLLQLAGGPAVYEDGAVQPLAFVPGNGKAPQVAAMSNDRYVVGYVANVEGPATGLRWKPAAAPPPPPANRAPVANAGGPYAAIAEGGTITFNGSGTDADGDALTYTWDFGDGALAVGATVPHLFYDNGVYAVKLIVRDEKGGVDTARVNVTVMNAAPAISGLKLDPSILNRPKVGQTFPVDFVWSDKGTRDAVWAYTIAWGDGVVETGRLYDESALKLTHVYESAGQRTAKVTITDKDGAGVSRSIPVDVQP